MKGILCVNSLPALGQVGGQLDIITSLPGLLRVGGSGVAHAASSVHGDSSDPPADGGLMFWVVSAQTHVPHPAGSASSEGGQRAP